MTPIAILIALSLEFFATAFEPLRSLRWFDAYRDRVLRALGAPAIGDGPLGVLAVLALPVLLVAVLQSVFAGHWLGLLSLALGVLALGLSLRYQPVDRLVDAYFDACESEEEDAARAASSSLFGGAAAPGCEQVQSVSEGLLVQANERLFAVLFWFAVLGPVGAVLYRLSWRLAAAAETTDLDETETADETPMRAGFTEAAARLHAILAWAPARLGAGAYALAGSFEDAVHQWRNYYQHSADASLESSEGVLRAAGRGALQLDRYVVQTEETHEGDVPLEPAAVNAARGLVLRALVIWVATIVVVTLALWAY